MWRTPSHRLALLELLVTGELPRRSEQADVWEELGSLGWARRSGRAKVLTLEPTRRGSVEVLLDRCWPDWKTVRDDLEREQLPLTPAGLSQLAERRRREQLPNDLSGRLNRRTASALVGGYSKGAPVQIPEVEVTSDFLVRLRPHAGLQVRRDAQVRSGVQVPSGAEIRSGAEARSGALVHSGVELAELLGELVLTSRALQDGTRLEGAPPRALLTVENQGPYLDLPKPEGWLIALLPGWDTRPVRPLLLAFPEVPWIHFGDLDPNGVRIERELRAQRSDLRWFVPDFWAEHLAHARPCRWPEGLVQPDHPPLVRRLAAEGRWLEQEPLTVDPRLMEALLASI